MSNFIYNSYCVVHPGAAQISLTADYPMVQEPAPSDAATASSFVWASVAVLAVLAGFALAGDGTMAVVGMALWLVALLGWAMNLTSVRRGLVVARQAVRAWQASRRQAVEDERTWHMALQDARMMADLSRAMSAQATR